MTWSFLHPGGQSVAAVAGQIAEFIGSAEQEVAVAIYDFHVDAGGGGEVITHALQSAEERGVRVRLVDHDERKSDYKSCIPSPQKPPEYIDSLGLDVRPVVDPYGLMHHKYVVVDGRRLWMGSLNWTDDAFTLQENVFLTFEAPALAEAYRQNFDELWELRVVEGTGEFDHAAVPVQSSSERVRARPIFCPDRGPALAADIAAAMRRARRRILVCSPVLTSGPILGALTDVLERDGLSISGVVDGTMMRGVLRQWDELTPESWKPDAYRYIARRTGFSGRPSTPWGPDRPHDYMHAKVVVCDDVAYVGSYNHSRSGEENAENVLAITGSAVVEPLAGFVETVVERYADGDAAAD